MGVSVCVSKGCVCVCMGVCVWECMYASVCMGVRMGVCEYRNECVCVCESV